MGWQRLDVNPNKMECSSIQPGPKYRCYIRGIYVGDNLYNYHQLSQISQDIQLPLVQVYILQDTRQLTLFSQILPMGSILTTILFVTRA